MFQRELVETPRGTTHKKVVITSSSHDLASRSNRTLDSPRLLDWRTRVRFADGFQYLVTVCMGLKRRIGRPWGYYCFPLAVLCVIFEDELSNS